MLTYRVPSFLNVVGPTLLTGLPSVSRPVTFPSCLPRRRPLPKEIPPRHGFRNERRTPARALWAHHGLRNRFSSDPVTPFNGRGRVNVVRAVRSHAVRLYPRVPQRTRPIYSRGFGTTASTTTTGHRRLAIRNV